LNTDSQASEESQEEEEDEPPIKRKIVSPGSDSEKLQKEATNSFKKREVPVYTCPEPECRYWSKLVNDFHDHVGESHGFKEPTFKCSVCTFHSQNWFFVHQHLREFREACDAAHSNALVVCVQPFPEHRYAEAIRLLEVPENMTQELLSRFGNISLKLSCLVLYLLILYWFRLDYALLQPSFAFPPGAV